MERDKGSVQNGFRQIQESTVKLVIAALTIYQLPMLETSRSRTKHPKNSSAPVGWSAIDVARQMCIAQRK